MTDLTTEQLAIAEKIKKLLNLAANNPSEGEAALAAAKAQELLAEYNLDSAAIERAGAGGGKREQIYVEGGFYSFHRELWSAVAKLNFCLYWSQKYAVANQKQNVYVGGVWSHAVKKTVLRQRHAVIGRTVNVQATIAMAGYLQQAIERVIRERLKNDDKNLTSTWAYSFRQGAAKRIVEKLNDRRRTYLSEEDAKKRAAERAASGASTATALTLQVYIDAETDANNDFIHGAGWSAKQATARADRARRDKLIADDYTRWCRDNPGEAKSKWTYTDDKGFIWSMGRSPSYRGGSKDKVKDRSAYYDGYDAAQAIGIDPQTSGTKSAGAIA